MREELVNKIKFQISEIDLLFEKYSDLFEKVKETTPDLIELTAIASVLHSFYNGIENIMSLISNESMEKNATGNNWHKKLLFSMLEEKSKQMPILRIESVDFLKGYLAFRHFFRHSYSFELNWVNLRDLTVQVRKTWDYVKSDFIEFVIRNESF